MISLENTDFFNESKIENKYIIDPSFLAFLAKDITINMEIDVALEKSLIKSIMQALIL